MNAEACGILTRKNGFTLVSRNRRDPKDTPLRVACRALETIAEVTKEEGVDEWWAHNGGKYDLCLLLEAVGALGWQAQGSVSGGRLIIFDVRIPNTKIKIRFLDSFAVVPEALRKISESFELKSAKLLGDEDYSVDVAKWTYARLYEGCRADCEVVLELIEKLDDLYTEFGGDLKVTFSSSTLSVLRSTVDILDLRDHKAENRFAERAFFGGRVEVYHHAPTHFLRSYDVTSSYPWSMSQRLPWLPQSTVSTRKDLSNALENPHVSAIVEARVTVPDACLYPPLPLRLDDGGLFFPTGTFEGTWAKNELLYAKSTGVQVQPLRALTYTTKQPFGQFVDRFFKLKATATGALRNFAKLNLNGCYGKFAQKPEKETLHICADEISALEMMAASEGNITSLSSDPRFLSEKKVSWPKQTHFAIAAHITAYSRILFHHRLSNAVNPAYGDTDSIHCESAAPVASPFETGFGDRLGEWKLERENFVARYFAPKLYELDFGDDKTNWVEVKNKLGEKELIRRLFKSKGFEVKPEIFEKIVDGEQVERGAMRLAKSALRDDLTAKYLQVKKSWHGNSQKRKAFADGSTRPWTYKELQRGVYKKQVSPLGEKAHSQYKGREK